MLFCPNCTHPGQRAISKEALQLARRMSGEKLEALMKEDLPAKVVDEVKDHMLNQVEEHIEKKLNTRKMLAAAVSEELK